jgi:hypothetical protein
MQQVRIARLAARASRGRRALNLVNRSHCHPTLSVLKFVPVRERRTDGASVRVA